MGNIQLDTAAERITAVGTAGDNYVANMEDIQNDLVVEANNSLGSMVEGQLRIVENDTEFQVTQGIPNAVSKSVKTAAAAVKQAGG